MATVRKTNSLPRIERRNLIQPLHNGTREHARFPADAMQLLVFLFSHLFVDFSAQLEPLRVKMSNFSFIVTNETGLSSPARFICTCISAISAFSLSIASVSCLMVCSKSSILAMRSCFERSFFSVCSSFELNSVVVVEAFRHAAAASQNCCCRHRQSHSLWVKVLTYKRAVWKHHIFHGGSAGVPPTSPLLGQRRLGSAWGGLGRGRAWPSWERGRETRRFSGGRGWGHKEKLGEWGMFGSC